MAAVAGEPVANPVLRAFADTVRLCGIRPEVIAAFMKSMKMDTRVFRYPTFEDLEVYTYGSAAVVGLMMCRVVGVDGRRADGHAEALGRGDAAIQLPAGHRRGLAAGPGLPAAQEDLRAVRVRRGRVRARRGRRAVRRA